jgi:glycosyltransferase involved in cell wall biosynthesis
LEAMAVGRAVITTDAPGCRETVRPFENGYLVPIKSVSALVHAFESFIINPKILTDMGICSRRFVEEKYDVRRVNDHILREMNFSDASLKSS